MKTTILSNASATRSALLDLLAWATEVEFAYAWMSSDEGSLRPWDELDDDKIARGVIGLHFAGTEPWCLEHFLEHAPDRVRVIEDTSGTFHPKVMLGRRGRQRRAVLGSSNFTPGGFGFNTELNILLSGTDEDSAFAEIKHAIEGYWSQGWPITETWLREYEARYEARPRPPTLPRRLPRVRAARAVTDLRIGWPEYYERIRSRAHEDIVVYSDDPNHETYLSEVKLAQEAFRKHGSFAKMPEDERKLVTASGSRFGYFGATRANGTFKNLVAERPEKIAAIIDSIPLEGQIPLSAVRNAFVRGRALNRVGIACITRLLCVKRPDRFPPVNGPNRQRMREVFGFAPKDLEGYLELLSVIETMPWYTSPAPEDRIERLTWRARVALLDAVLYDPEKR